MKHNTLLLCCAVLSAVPATRAADANDPSAHWAASVQAETDKKYPDALNEMRVFEQQNGDPFLVAERTGWLLYLSADYAKAEVAYNRAKQLQPTALNPLLGLLSVAQAAKDAKKIEHAAEDILRLEPTNYRAQTTLGSLHFANRDYRRSASDYRRVLMSYPEDPDALSGAAWSVFYVGMKHEAADYFRRLVTINPSYAYAQRGFDLSMGKIPQPLQEAAK